MCRWPTLQEEAVTSASVSFREAATMMMLIQFGMLVLLVTGSQAFNPFNSMRKAFHDSSSLIMSSVSDAISKKVSDNTVMVFSKSYCPFCDRAKSALSELNIPFVAEELDVVAGGAQTQAALLEMTGQRTVPNVFVKGKHLGGCDDTLAALKSGAFQKMLE